MTLNGLDTEFDSSTDGGCYGDHESIGSNDNSIGDSDFKENYNTNTSPIRKSIINHNSHKYDTPHKFDQANPHKFDQVNPSIKNPSKDATIDNDNLSMLNLFSYHPTTNSQVIHQIYTNLQYLKSVTIKPVDLKSILADTTNSKSSISLILRLFSIINVMNSLNNSINLYNFKHQLLVNNCIKMLGMYKNDLSFDNTDREG